MALDGLSACSQQSSSVYALTINASETSVYLPYTKLHDIISYKTVLLVRPIG
jgi:hypothetical protein